MCEFDIIRNIHKGKRAVICGSGPSVNTIKKIESTDIVFAINQSVTRLTRWDYYCNSCLSINGYNPSLFQYGVKNAAKNTIFSGHINVSALHLTAELREKVLCLSRDKLRPETWSQEMVDSPTTFLHFAHFMGCSPIVLVGCEMTYGLEGKKYCESNDEIGVIEWPGFRFKEYEITINGVSVMTDNELDTSFNGWVNIKKNNPDIIILNGSGACSRLALLFDTIEI